MNSTSCQLAVTYNANFEIKISKQIGHRKDKHTSNHTALTRIGRNVTSKHQDKWSEILLNKPLFSRTFLLFIIISYLSSCHKSQEVVLDVFQELIALLMAINNQKHGIYKHIYYVLEFDTFFRNSENTCDNFYLLAE